MSEFYDLDKEDTLYNYIIGKLTTMKSNDSWDKDAQREFFNIRIPNFLYTLRWSSRDKCEVTYRNTKQLVIDIEIHYAEKDKSCGYCIRCNDFKNFFYEPDVEILDISRYPKHEAKERTIRDDIHDITDYVHSFMEDYRQTFTRWTIRKQKDLLEKLKRDLNVMVLLRPEYESVSIEYDHSTRFGNKIRFDVKIHPTDHGADDIEFPLVTEYDYYW